MALRQYRVDVTGPAGRDLAALAKRPPSGSLLQRLDEAIMSLAEDPRPAGTKKLARGEETWRIRIGDYRILYEVDDQSHRVTIARVLHRSQAYREP